MKYKQIREKKGAELQKLLSEKREALRTIRFGEAGSKSKNVKEARMIRKTIARILTAAKAQGNV